MRLRPVIAALVLVVLAVTVAGCSMLPGGSTDGYKLTAYFTKAVALYEASAVKVMGVDAGKVDSVELIGEDENCDVVDPDPKGPDPENKNRESDCVKIEITIKKNVPLPRNAIATIQPLTLIGERNVVFAPAFTGGERLQDGDVLNVNQTGSSVEPDDALRAFTELAQKIDPDNVARLISGGAEALDGRGETFNNLLAEASGVTSTLAKQDERIIEVANNLHQVVSGLNTRDTQVGRLIDSLAQASGVLADERQALSALLSSAVRLTDVGTALIGAYEDQLPVDIAVLTRTGYVLEANVQTVIQLVAAFPTISQALVNAYSPALPGLELGIPLATSVDSVLSEFLKDLGVPLPPVLCSPLLGVDVPLLPPCP